MTNKDTSSLLSVCAAYVQKYDPDYFYCTLFAPIYHRELIFRLLAFNIEITRAVSLPSSWSVAGPMAGFIRLQWWRELIEGKDRTHEIAPFVKESIAHGLLPPKVLLGMIEAKEEELDGIKDWSHWESMLMRSSGKFNETIARMLGVEDSEKLKAIAFLGMACETVRIARYLPNILSSGRCPLPKAVIDEYHLQRTDDGISFTLDMIKGIRALLMPKATEYLKVGKGAHSLGRKKIVSVLPTVFAKRDLRKSKKWDLLPDRRGAGDQLSVMWSNFRGKISV